MPLRQRKNTKAVTVHQTATTGTRKAGGTRTTTFSLNRARAGSAAPFSELLHKAATSNQLLDPFTSDYAASTGVSSGRRVLEPMYSPTRLAAMPLNNNTLKQCIEVYVTNVAGKGHQLEYVGPEGQERSAEAQAEKRRLSAFLASCSPELSFRQVCERAVADYETLGGRCFEVARNRRGQIVMFDHVPAGSIRMTTRDREPTEIPILIPDPEGEGYIKHTVTRFFRRFVQQKANGQKVYFKEFGDPRPIDPDTGEVNANLAIEDHATEILYDGQYVPGSTYGLPRWIGQVPAILGSRESEIVNLNFFRDNAIPALAVLVSGGMLTEESFRQIEAYINAVRGQDAMHRVMVLEAAADEAAGGIDHSQPAPKIDIKPMISERQQDGLFKEYDEHNSLKVRSAFRLPPIFIGRAEDYTRASATASILMAENQVFSPERERFDEWFNARVLATHQPRFWRLRSLGAQITDHETMRAMVDTFGKQGALTPNVVIRIANKIFDTRIDPITDTWGNVPFQVIMEQVRLGGAVEGLDDYVDMLANQPDALPGPGPGDTEPVNDNRNKALKAMRDTLRREMKVIASDLRDAVNEGLQTLHTSANVGEDGE